MGSFDPEDLGRAYFYCVTCPRSETCSAHAWKRANVWGWSEEQCRKRLHHHLANSSRHTEEFASSPICGPTEVADMADVIEDIVTESKVTEPQADRQRKVPMAQVSKRKAEPPTSKDVAQQVVQQLVQMQSGATSSNGGGGDEFRVKSYSRREMVETVPLRLMDLQRIDDALVRASKAARYAQTLTASASTAFANEAATLEQCGEIIKALIPPSTT